MQQARQPLSVRPQVPTGSTCSINRHAVCVLPSTAPRTLTTKPLINKPQTHLDAQQALVVCFLPDLWQQRQQALHMQRDVLSQPLNNQIHQPKHLCAGVQEQQQQSRAAQQLGSERQRQRPG